MKTSDMNTKKPTGAISMGHEPSHNAMPKIITTIPRYIGLRENRNGPEVTKQEARSVGRMGVPLCRKSHHAHIMARKPKTNATTPQAMQAKSSRYSFGSAKCSPTLTASSSHAIWGGLT